MTKAELLKQVHALLYVENGDLMSQHRLEVLQKLVHQEMDLEESLGTLTQVKLANGFPYTIDGQNWASWLPERFVPEAPPEGDEKWA